MPETQKIKKINQKILFFQRDQNIKYLFSSEKISKHPDLNVRGLLFQFSKRTLERNKFQNPRVTIKIIIY